MMKIQLAAIAYSLLLPSMVVAGSIDWGTAVSDQLYNAAGSPLTSNYRFEIGTFKDGFIPDAGNTAQWESKWKLIEEASFNAPAQYVAENSILTTSGPNLIWERDATGDESGPLTNPNIFTPTESVYFWAFDTKSLTGAAQWALITGNGSTLDTEWDLTADLGNPLAQTRQWRLSNADTAIFGGINGTRGGGVFQSLPSSFTLQTAELVPIPEPGIAVLIVLATALSFHRRRTSPS